MRCIDGALHLCNVCAVVPGGMRSTAAGRTFSISSVSDIVNKDHLDVLEALLAVQKRAAAEPVTSGCHRVQLRDSRVCVWI